jgi:drug/metabolite transporter (DMT)-like permease
MIWLCIAVRIVANPFSNVFQKLLTQRSANPLVIIGITHALLSLVCAAVLFLVPVPTAANFWTNISICALLAVTANALIVQALSLSDLSVLGPINAWKPVISLVPGMLLLHEFPGWPGVCGIVLIVAGSYLIVDGSPREPWRTFRGRFLMDRGVQCRFAGLVLSAVEAVFLKRSLLTSSATTTFVWWSILGFFVSGVAVTALMGSGKLIPNVDANEQISTSNVLSNQAAVFHQSWLTYVMLATTTGLMQFCTIVTLDGLQVGSALALFQTSALISVFLGSKVFDEPHFLRRMSGAVVMVAGAVLIIVGGQPSGTP